MHDNMDNPLHSFGVIECIVCESIHARTELLPFQLAWAPDSSWFWIYDGGYTCVSQLSNKSLYKLFTFDGHRTFTWPISKP